MVQPNQLLHCMIVGTDSRAKLLKSFAGNLLFRKRLYCFLEFLPEKTSLLVKYFGHATLQFAFVTNRAYRKNKIFCFGFWFGLKSFWWVLKWLLKNISSTKNNRFHIATILQWFYIFYWNKFLRFFCSTIRSKK